MRTKGHKDDFSDDDDEGAFSSVDSLSYTADGYIETNGKVYEIRPDQDGYTTDDSAIDADDGYIPTRKQYQPYYPTDSSVSADGYIQTRGKPSFFFSDLLRVTCYPLPRRFVFFEIHKNDLPMQGISLGAGSGHNDDVLIHFLILKLFDSFK